MGGIEIDAHGRPTRPGADHRQHRSEGFGKHRARPTVQESVGLGVPGDRHRGHSPGR